MGIYAGLSDCADPVVEVAEEDLVHADRVVGRTLKGRGIDPDLVVADDALELLRDLAVAEATARAAARLAADGGDTALWAKQRYYQADAIRIGATISRETMGLESLGSGTVGYSSIPVGRG